MVSDVLRLERIRSHLVDRGLDAAGATLVVFGRRLTPLTGKGYAGW